MQTILTQFHRTPSPWSLELQVCPLLLALSIVIVRAACALAADIPTPPLVFAGSSGSMVPMKALIEAYRVEKMKAVKLCWTLTSMLPEA